MRRRWLLLAGATLLGEQRRRAQAACSEGLHDQIVNELVGHPYDRHLRPGHLGPPTPVEVQLDIQSLVSVDPKHHFFEVLAYWRTTWLDSRLQYRHLDIDGCFPRIKMNMTGEVTTPLKSHYIWTPDLYFDNAKEEFYGSYFFWVSEDGKVLRSILIKHQFECKMDFTHLPFDAHVCLIDLLSYSETADEVTIAEKDGLGITLNPSGKNVTEWIADSLGGEVLTNHYGTGDDAYPWDTLRLRVRLERSQTYHMRTDASYTILFVIMTYSGFFINRKVAPARVTVALIPVLTIVNLLNHIDAQLPRIEYSWLSVFLSISLMYSVVAVIEYGLIWVLMAKEEERQERFATLRCLAEKLSEARRPDGEDAGVVREGEVAHAASAGGGKKALTPSQEAMFRESYRLFDRKHSGEIPRRNLHVGLRHFNQYFSPDQIAEIFEKMGVAEGDPMTKEQFIKYLVRLPIPAAASDVGFFDKPPSLCLDIVTRSAFLISYLLIVVVMLIWAQTFP